MKIQNVHDEAFRPYGKVITTVDCTSLCEAMMNTECPADHTIYVASDPEIEKVDSFAAFRDQVYGGMPIQIGDCNGSNHKLNGLEYHRDSEVNVAVNDLILLLGKEQDIDPETFAYDSSKVEAFLVPAGTCIEVYDPETLEGYQQFAYEKGVFSRPFLKYLYSMVPYIIEEKELVKIFDTMKEWFLK